MSLTHEQEVAAIRDPAYHRHLCFGSVDRARQEQMGRPLLPHETQSKMFWPQVKIARRLERAVANREGGAFTIRSARQTTKNESEAQLESRMLAMFRGVPGSVYVRTAPTYRPQIVNSKLRLEKFLQRDPILAGRWRKREGFIIESGEAQIHFLSGGANSNIVGATASIALSIDEAHKIDAAKFEEDIAPFTASTNAPMFMWGVAAAKLDLLYEYHERNRGTDRFMEYPADVWCELNPAYAAHYAERVAKLGDDHPVILTQYKLVDVESIGGFMSDAQRASLFSGDHPRTEAPRAGMRYGALIDMGGESERDASSEDVRLEEPDRDSTIVWIFEWDPAAPALPYPLVRIVAGFWWTGQQHTSLLPEIRNLCAHWQIRAGCVDARGVGEAVAMGLSREFPCMVPYLASSVTVSQDCFDFQARLNTGRVKFWKGDPAADDLLREVHAQARHTRYTIHGHELMKLSKPTGAGSGGQHIDGIKALTYLRVALEASPRSGVFDMMVGKMKEREAKGATA